MKSTKAKPKTKRKTEGKTPVHPRAKTDRAAGATPKRVAAILAKLDEAYPQATCALEHTNPFQLLIATILSAQCTDVRVNQVTKILYQKYRTPKDFAFANPA